MPTGLKSPRPRRLICLVLVLLTIGLYLPANRHAFINFDDDQYVTGNFHVQAGLTWQGIAWAFKSGYADNWHPLTWISHMLDCQVYGLNSAGHHFTNILFHTANSILLFLFLSHATGTIWRSGFVAALFACHPLHVESVAWVAERKDLLSTFFWMLTLLCYGKAVTGDKCLDNKRRNAPGHPTTQVTCHLSPYYWLALLFFACGLMSKPMVVTLPFALLLLDFWPFQRLNISNLRRALVEKVPFFALSIVSSVVTFSVQRTGAVASLVDLPLSLRLDNAVVSYGRYAFRIFWPVDLSILYPFPAHWPSGLITLATLFVLACSVAVIWFRRRYPYLFVGWFWFAGTLVPVIGLVQVGLQAMADRYMYIPSIGLFIVMVWGLHALLEGRLHKKWAALGAGIVALTACVVETRTQLHYWQNSITLFSRAREVTPDNYATDDHLGEALDQAGQYEKAIPFLEESIRINPHDARGLSELGTALAETGRLPEAIECFRGAVQLRPNDTLLHYDLGAELIEQGQLDQAATQLLISLQLNPGLAAAHRSLAMVLLKKGDITGALEHFSAAVQLNPDWAQAHFDYGFALLNNKQPADAAVQFYRQLALDPYQAQGHYRLAEALSRQHKSEAAIAEFWNALRLAPDSPGALNELAWILATDPDPAVRAGKVAVHLAERACNLTHHQNAAMLATLGAAYAETGRFSEAIAAAQKARDLASAAGQKDLAVQSEQFIQLYHSGCAYRQSF